MDLLPCRPQFKLLFVFSLYILPDRELSNSLLPKFYNWKLSSSLFTIGTLVINIIYFVLLDRLMMAAVQRRTGPYNVGYFGLLQPMDDGLKLVKNEVIIPKKSSCILFLVVPNLFFYCSLILWSIIPLEGFCYNMDFTFNIFLQLFISNVQVVTNMSSGVTSNSK